MYLKLFGETPGKKPTWPSSQLQTVARLSALNVSDFYIFAQSFTDI